MISPEDLEIDYYRAATDCLKYGGISYARVTHKPTGIVVQSEERRSASHNKSKALEMLKTKLDELEKV